MISAGSALMRLEDALAGASSPDVRRNLRIELASALVYGPFQTVLTFLPIVMTRLGATPEMIAIYQAASYLGFVCVPLFARWVPAQGSHRVLTITWSVARFFVLPMALAQSPWVLLVLSIVLFFLDGLPSPAYTRVVQLAYPARVRGRSLGYVRLGLGLGTLVFTPVGGWILDTYGYHILFPICALAGLASIWIFGRMRIDESAAPAAAPAGSRRLWDVVRQDRRYRVYLLGVALFGFGGLLPTAFYPAVIVTRLNLSYTEVSLLGAVQSLCGLAGYVLWGQMADRVSGVRVLRVTYFIMAIIPASYAVAGSGWMLLPAFVVQGLASAGIDLAFQSCTIELAKEDRTYDYAALHRTVVGMRGLIAPMIGVSLALAGAAPEWIMMIGVLFYVMAGLLMLHPVFRRAQGAQ